MLKSLLCASLILFPPLGASADDHDVAFTQDGRLVMLSDTTGGVFLYTTEKAELLQALRLKTGQFMQAAAVSSDGRKVLTSSGGSGDFLKQRLRLWDVVTGKYEQWGGKHPGVGVLAFSPDGKTALSGDIHGASYWNVDSGKALSRLLPDAGLGQVYSIAFLPDGKRALLGTVSSVQLWDLTARRMTGEFPLKSGADSLVVSRDGRQALAGDSDGRISLLDLGSANVVRTWDGHTEAAEAWNRKIIALAFSNDGLTALSCARDDLSKEQPGFRVRRWYLANGQKTADDRFSGHLSAGAFSQDGRLLAVNEYREAPRLVPVPEGSSSVAAGVEVPKPKAVPSLVTQVAFTEPSGDRVLDAEEEGTLELTVVNNGQGPAYAVAATLSRSAVEGLDVPETVAFGDLPPGKSESRKAALKASGTLPTGQVKIKVEVHEGNGFDADPVLLELQTRAFQAPKLELAEVSIGGSGVVKAGEINQVTVKVRNAGSGPAEDVSAALVTGSPDIFSPGETTASLGTLAPGRSGKAEFQFVVNKRFKGKELPVSVTLAESRGKYGTEAPLRLALGESAPSLKVVTIKGSGTASPAVPAEAEDVDAPPASAAKPDPEAYAVVVGIEKYRDLPGVEYAAKDAQSVRSYLVRAMGFEEKNVALLQNERAGKNDLETYLGPWLADRVTAKSRVFVFYAGHGAPDPTTGEAYLLPYDGNPAYAKTTAFPVRHLYDALAKLPTSDVTVVMDACFSGAGGRSVLAKGARPLVMGVRGTSSVGPNTVSIAASGPDQISTFHPEGGHGLLTYYLLKGLRGEADADHDGKVTTEELFSYLRPNVEREARLQHVEQTPVISPEVRELGEKGRRVWVRAP